MVNYILRRLLYMIVTVFFVSIIGFALIQHGAPAPVVLTFMIAASGLSLPEMIVLGRVLRPLVVVGFVGATMVVYVVVGFGFVWV